MSTVRHSRISGIINILNIKYWCYAVLMQYHSKNWQCLMFHSSLLAEHRTFHKQKKFNFRFKNIKAIWDGIQLTLSLAFFLHYPTLLLCNETPPCKLLLATFCNLEEFLDLSASSFITISNINHALPKSVILLGIAKLWLSPSFNHSVFVGWNLLLYFKTYSNLVGF